MATNTSFKIEFHGQSSFNSKVSIDRSMPAMLSDRMSNHEWIAFCDRVDQALEPIQAIKNTMLRHSVVSVAVSFGLFILIAVMGFTGRIVSFSGGGFSPLYIILLVAFIFVPFALQFYRMRGASRDVTKVYDDLRKVVNEESSKRSDVSFHLKEDTHTTYYNASSSRTNRVQTRTISYIECNISFPGGGHHLLNGDGHDNVPVSATVASPVVIPSMFDTLSGGGGTSMVPGKSAQERLQELEGVKAFISEEEYNKKKEAILASI
jgi:hypothetical protein